jgi:hypothetical protein
MQRPARRTRSDAPTVLRAMLEAYRRVMGREPVSVGSYALPTAVSALETAQWQQMFDWNAGNITTSSPDYSLRGGNNPLHFRIYPSLAAGALDLVHWLAVHGAIAAADAQDLEGFAAAMQRGCYAGCDPSVYSAGDALGGQLSALGGVAPASSDGVKLAFVGGSLVAALGMAAAGWYLSKHGVRHL